MTTLDDMNKLSAQLKMTPILPAGSVPPDPEYPGMPRNMRGALLTVLSYSGWEELDKWTPGGVPNTEVWQSIHLLWNWLYFSGDNV